MTRCNRIIIVNTISLALWACGDGTDKGSAASVAEEVAKISTSTVEVASKPGASNDQTVKPQGPVTITYKIIGVPVVGQPVAVDLQVKSTLGPRPVTLSYRVNDSTAMQFSEAQTLQVSIAPTNDERPSLQQVRVIPMREGRLFLNVSATIQTEGGTISTW